MAQAPQNPGEGGANFVREIVAKPDAVPDITLLYGYLGASSEEGHERVYLSPDLSNWVEVPATAILHRAQATKEQDPHGGVTLWVKKDAALKYKMAPAQEALAHYFAGAIQAGAPVAGPAVAGFAPQPTPTARPTWFGYSCNASCGFACTFAPPCNLLTQRTPCPGVSCGIDCTVIGPACHVTRGQPQCAYPTEATCWPVCGGSLQAAVCQNPLPQNLAAAPQVAAAAQGGPAGLAGGAGVSFVDCSIVCPTRVFTCAPCGGVDSNVLCPTHVVFCRTHPPHATCGIDCSIVCPTRAATCNPICTVDSNVLCPTYLAPCVTQNSCGIACTVAPPCLALQANAAPQAQANLNFTVGGCPTAHWWCHPTRIPDTPCPYPTEICTHVHGCHPQLQAAAAPAAQAAQFCAGQSFQPTPTAIPSIYICHQTFLGVSCNLVCRPSVYIACSIPCGVSQNPALCQGASGLAACVPQNPGGPVEQAQAALWRPTAGYPCSYLCTAGAVCRTPGCPW